MALIMTQLYLEEVEWKKKSMTKTGAVQIPSWPSFLFVAEWGKSTFGLCPHEMDLCRKMISFLKLAPFAFGAPNQCLDEDKTCTCFLCVFMQRGHSCVVHGLVLPYVLRKLGYFACVCKTALSLPYSCRQQR